MIHKILIVDDNVDQATSLGMLLTALGYEVDEAHDGITAIDMVDRLKPDVVVLDIGLPGMDGYAVARQVTAKYADNKPLLIALTGYDLSRNGKAGKMDFDFHMVKPLDIKLLKNILSERGSETAESL